MTQKDARARRIADFFAWHRARATNAARLAELPGGHGIRSFVPDQHILLAAGLDALAKFWGDAFRPELTRHRARFGQFLSDHSGHDAFARVAGPDIRRRAAQKAAPWLPALASIVGDTERNGRVRGWRDDPRLDTLLTEPRIVALAIGAEWLRESRYGEILYRHHRCGWLHESNASDELAPPDADDHDGEPRYQSLLLPREDAGDTGADENGSEPRVRRKHRLVFTTGFLLSVYLHAVDSLERSFVAADLAPGRK